MNAMTKAELAVLPKGTQLFVISRKISRSGMRQVFDVFYIEPNPRKVAAGCSSLRWIRIAREDSKDFHAHAECHATTSIEQDRKLGGTFYVNGCGCNRAQAVVNSLSVWVTGKPGYFRMEAL